MLEVDPDLGEVCGRCGRLEAVNETHQSSLSLGIGKIHRGEFNAGRRPGAIFVSGMTLDESPAIIAALHFILVYCQVSPTSFGSSPSPANRSRLTLV